MSQLHYSLQILGFSDIRDVTAESLKKAFKVTVLRAHPDKGGDPEDFDRMLSAYLYLLETVQRLHGGRRTLQGMVSPDELKESRIDEVINRIFDEFNNDIFNAKFEAQHKRDDHGYASWLQESKEDSNVTDGTFGNATQKPPMISESELHSTFEKTAREGKTIPTSMILHPDQLAYVSGSLMGTALLESSHGSYTSDLYANPEYTDVYSAFTKDNTLCDKVHPFSESKEDIEFSIEKLLEERNKVIEPLNHEELEAIALFEKERLQKDQEHLSNIKSYFECGQGNGGGSLENWPSSSDTKKENGFIISLGGQTTS